MAEQNGNDRIRIKDVYEKTVQILQEMSALKEWKDDNVNPRLQSYGKRIRFIEIVFGGGISVSVIVYIIKTFIIGE